MDGGELRRREVAEAIWKGGGSEEMDGLVWGWERKEAWGGWKMTS